jgi:hypothetical protein
MQPTLPRLLPINGGSSNIEFALFEVGDSLLRILHGGIDRTAPNDLDRFHLVMNAIDRLPQTGARGIHLKQQLKEKPIEHAEYIYKQGQGIPEIRNWNWTAITTEEPA